MNKNNVKQVGVSCPRCGPATFLVVKTNGETEEQFLGCPNYPECRHTRNIPEEWKMRLGGQKELFDAVT